MGYGETVRVRVRENREVCGVVGLEFERTERSEDGGGVEFELEFEYGEARRGFEFELEFEFMRTGATRTLSVGAARLDAAAWNVLEILGIGADTLAVCCVS